VRKRIPACMSDPPRAPTLRALHCRSVCPMLKYRSGMSAGDFPAHRRETVSFVVTVVTVVRHLPTAP
jgi:hypothetical protein